MSPDAILESIKNTVHSFLPDSKVLLFGSRARGDSDHFSDYDLLLIMPGIVTQSEKLSWSRVLRRAIVKDISAPIDLLLFGEGEIAEKKEFPGHIVRTALREGIAL